jgi:hypothetical protein
VRGNDLEKLKTLFDQFTAIRPFYLFFAPFPSLSKRSGRMAFDQITGRCREVATKKAPIDLG